jgi:DNA-binding NtrC family response regulator
MRATTAAPVDTPKILLVEDDAMQRVAIEDALIARGFECRHASTLESALDILKTEDFSAAILDVNIQGTAVFSLARAVRARGVQCVFTTGYTDAVIPPEFADAPYFQKPVNIDRVIDAVAKCAKKTDGS